MKDLGKKLSTSIDIIEKFFIEINSLELIIQQKLFNMVNNIKSDEKIRITSDWITSFRDSESNWISTDISGSLGLSPPRKKNPKRYLSYQISLAGDAVETADNQDKEPLVHINLWDTPISFSEGMYSCVYWTSEDKSVFLEQGTLFCWPAKTNYWHDKQWSYAIKLTQLNDETCVDDLITIPCQQLLLGKDLTSTIIPKSEAIYRPIL
ncbi:hypothetical protein [Thalassospira sp. MCCC 1A03138]|uniref:hypothetical protein n=1 Tax=Thalassospira sp. MCCC 1A03138 TaxID=1470576 RepID=UPI000A1E806D|nr:hypothetical protein [Thalassospira sp. MCCC 1A03138]OSQ31185.1 hypothetical protein TH468_09575 [Thalassospira sp. MCCC 1A03138]